MKRVLFLTATLCLMWVWGVAVRAHPQSSTPLRESRTGMEFIRIAPGIFRMGCSEGDTLCDPDENPAQDVRITKAFELGKYEVTQAQWLKVMDRNPSMF